MRILLVIMSFYPHWGGTENQARRQAVELVRRGHTVDVVTWREDPSLPREEWLDGIRILRTDRGTGALWKRLYSMLPMLLLLRRLARQADVVVAHQVHGLALLAGWVALSARRPVIAKLASSAAGRPSDTYRLSRSGIVGELMRLAALPIRRGGIAVAMTDEIERDLTRAGFRRRVRIPNGIVVPDPVDKQCVRARLVGEVGIGAHEPLVVSAGRPDPLKGFDVLITAWAEIIKHVPRAQLVIVGPGKDDAPLRMLCARFGLDSSVHCLPASEATADWIAAADVVAIPSRAEGMSNVLLEAMAAATPVVATAVSGAVDLIRDGQNGRLVPTGDAQGLGRAIVETLRCPGDMGVRGRETVLSRCRLDHVVDLYERTFKLARHLPPGTTTAEMLLEYADTGTRQVAAG